MANFGDLAADSIGDRYKGGIKVHLESQDDVEIIGSKWFVALKERISFENAGTGTPDGTGGCGLVLQRVREARKQGLTAYGIVDRDILMADPAHHSHFWQTDDRAFAGAKPFGPDIYILGRWEIENLLLHPEAIAHVIKNRNLGGLKPSAAGISDALIAVEGDLICITLLSTLTVTKGQPSPRDGFGTDKGCVGGLLKQAVMAHLMCTQDDFDAHHSQVVAFAEHQSTSEQRWNRLSRLLDGKRLMERLPRILPDLAGTDMTKERGHLADLMKNLNLIDQMEPGLGVFLRGL